MSGGKGPIRWLHWLSISRPSPDESVSWEIEHHLEEIGDRLRESGWEPAAARLEAEAERLLAVGREREALAAAQAGDLPGADRAVAEMNAAIERMSGELGSVRGVAQDDSAAREAALREMIEEVAARLRDGNLSERQSKVQRLAEEAAAVQAESRRLDSATASEADVQKTIEEAIRLSQRALRDFERLQEAPSEGNRREIYEMVAALRGAELSAQAAKLIEIRDALNRQIEELRKAQADLQAQHRALQEELERLRSESKK